MKLFLPLILFLNLIFAPTLFAQTPTLEQALNQNQTEIRLGTRVIEPFVIEDNSQYSGFSIDLWNELAKGLNLKTTQTKAYTNVQNLLDGVASNEVDAGIAAVSITSEREQTLDFSYPMFKSGLGILTKSQSESDKSTLIFSQLWKATWTRDFGILCLWILLISLIPATIIYFLERRKVDGFLDTRNPIEGIIQAYWWGITALAGQQENHPATKSGRIFGVFWMFFGVLFIAFFTAQITSNLTAEKLQGEINSLSDLQGKKVSTIKASTASKFLKDKEIEILESENVKDAVAKVDKGEAAAVVFDSPPLEYFVKQNESDKYALVGGLVTTEDYGIVLPKNSNLRTQINQQILKMQESGQYTQIRERWFGKTN